MKPEGKYRRARQTAWRTIADETVVLDLEGKRMYGLNPAAGVVWQALDEAEDSGVLLRLIAGDRPPTFGEPEIAAFINELVALGLAEEQQRTAGAGTVELPIIELPEELDPPAIAWCEDVEQIAGTCAFFPSTSPICNQVPFS